MIFIIFYRNHIITDNQVSKHSQLFEIIDSDKDGKIKFEEAADWFSKMKNESKDIALVDEQFRNLFNETDKNADGFIQPEELDNVQKLAKLLAANFLPQPTIKLLPEKSTVLCYKP